MSDTPSPSQPRKSDAAGRTRQVLVCRRGDSYYGFCDKSLLAVSTCGAITPLPRARHLPFLGVANVRGRAALVADLDVLLGRAPAEAVASEGHRRRLILVRNDGAETGLLVDEVMRFLQVADTELRHSGCSTHTAVDGVFLWGNEAVSLLNVNRLLQTT